MSDWTSLRLRAQEHHRRLRALCRGANEPLIPAEALLAAAAREIDYEIKPLRLGDTLLSGAQALLDRESEVVWYAVGPDCSPERQRFAQAHEFGHYWLHSPEADACTMEDSPQTYMASLLSPGAQVEQGYSPQERREREANVFAAEFLLPAPFLREAFVEKGWRADRIARVTGLSEACVLSQLSQAVLVPYGAHCAGPVPNAEPAPVTSLDASQLCAATVEHGPVLVDAGPGTGKTRTLIARIEHLLTIRSAAPEEIIALTFSNKAAEEIRARLLKTVGTRADRVWIGTFHAFGFEILRKEGQAIGLPVRPSLLEPGDAISLLERHYDLLHLSEYEYLHDPALPFPDILDCISRAKDELKSPADYAAAADALAQQGSTEDSLIAAAKAREVAHVYAVYQELLDQNGYLDYGDLIYRSVALLESFPDIKVRWQARFPHILADEYQDINRACARLLQCLAGEGKGFWAVGDLRQAIYRFRGASPANIRQFEQDFPRGRRLSLEVNYRSVSTLVDLFSRYGNIMEGGSIPTPGNGWRAARGQNNAQALTVAVLEDEEAQLDWIAAQIRGWELAGVAKPQQAILTATNRQAAEIAEGLEARGIAAQHLGGLFERPEVKDLLCLLSLAAEPQGTGLARVALIPQFALSETAVRQILEQAGEGRKTFAASLARVEAMVALSAQERERLRELNAAIQPIAYHGDAWYFLNRFLFQTSDYLRPLVSDDSVASRQKLLAIYHLLACVQNITQRLPLEGDENSRSAFLLRLRRILQTRQARSVRLPDGANEIDGVRIMTIHQAKGLEFSMVYLPNMVKGQFPGRGRSNMASLPPGLLAPFDVNNDEMATDDSLFFVAMSRARDHLVFSRPGGRKGKTVAASPYLDQIEPDLTALHALRVTMGSANRPVERLLRFGSQALTQGDAHRAVENLQGTGRESGAADQNNPSKDATGEDAPPLPLSAVEQYLRCPRQYYYHRVAKLPDRGEASPYRDFDVNLQSTIHWIQAERIAGRLPTQREAEVHLSERWKLSAPHLQTPQEKVLRDRAQDSLARIYAELTASEHYFAETALNVKLGAGTIRLRSDQTENLPDGTVRLTTHLHRPRKKKTDHTHPRLSLLRLAARQQAPERPAEIRLFSTADGETFEVKENARYEPARVARYEAALENLKAGRYPAEPEEDRECRNCPFFFICPGARE